MIQHANQNKNVQALAHSIGGLLLTAAVIDFWMGARP